MIYEWEYVILVSYRKYA